MNVYTKIVKSIVPSDFIFALSNSLNGVYIRSASLANNRHLFNSLDKANIKSHKINTLYISDSYRVHKL